MFSLLTCADTNYFPMALALAKNVRLYKSYVLYLYDLGLEESEKKILTDLGVIIEAIPQEKDIFDFNSKGLIRTTHKMGCVEHFISKYKKSVVIIDADILFIEDAIKDIFPDLKDIVVTYRCDRERKPYVLVNGKINAGVMGFGANIKKEFFERWKSLCADGEHTDQSAISELLEEKVKLDRIGTKQKFGDYTIRVVDGNIYNDVTCRVGKIFHFKRVGRRWNKRMGFFLFSFLQRSFPHLMKCLIRINREKKIFVWYAKK